MGEWAAAELPKPDYSRQTDNRVGLTDAGNALAADIGLLVADTLTGKHPQLEWETVPKPPNDMSFNPPVLVGFNNGMYLDLVGSSIAEAIAVLRGDRD